MVERTEITMIRIKKQTIHVCTQGEWLSERAKDKYYETSIHPFYRLHPPRGDATLRKMGNMKTSFNKLKYSSVKSVPVNTSLGFFKIK